MRMIRHIAIGLVAGIALAACNKEEERGVSRIPGLPEGQSPRADITAPDVRPSGEHQAPPLSELAGGSGPHSGAAATTGSAAGGEDMMIQAGQTNVRAGGNILEVAGLAFTVDEDWKNVEPASSVRVAEYQLEGEAGPAEMAVFYFGQNQGGGIEDNIRRWAGQFTPEDGTAADAAGAQVARMEKESLRMALVKTEGTYDPGSMGPMGPANTGPKPGYALFGLVVAGGPEGSVFIKVTGPKETIAEHSEALEAMAQSARVSDYR